MAWIKVESSVRTHKKFLTAGPAPSWLWLCGLGYSQEGLTDGFIPTDALGYLGVKNAKQLAVHLVKAGLWDEVGGGWRIHDYLEHNRSASHVASIKQDRRSAGQRGGLASGATRTKQVASNDEANVEATVQNTSKHASNPSVAVAVVAAEAVAVDQGKGAEKHFDGQSALRELEAAYPPQRVTSGYRTSSEFFGQLGADDPAGVYATMRANLENHKRSHEWRVKGMAPALEKWLRDGLWKRQMDEAAPAAEQLTVKTNRTLAAAAEILRGQAS